MRLQEETGLPVVTDGEFRRSSYWSHFVDGIDGLDVRPARYTFRDEGGSETEFLAPHTAGRLRRNGPIGAAELEFLQSVAQRNAKITLPSPPTMHFWRGRDGVDRSAYPKEDEFFEELAAIYRDEIADLAARGAVYLQLDEVPLAMLCDPQVQQRLEADGESAQRLIDRYLSLIRKSLPTDLGLVYAMHLCRGNYQGRWLSEGSYAPIAERLFNELPIDVFLLEYDTERAGDFAPLRHLPAGKRALLGLVSTKTADLESPDELRRRIDEAARHTDIDRLGICPQCGFASTVGGNPVTEDDERRKLELIVEVANQVWGSL